MRTFTRKLLSLLLAFTMVCAMVPAALAQGEGTGEEPTPGEGGDISTECNHTTKTYVANNNGTHKVTCLDCQKEIDDDENCTASAEYKMSASGDTYQHWQVCSKCGAEIPSTRKNCTAGSGYEGGTATHWQECSTCGQKMNETPHDANAQWVTTDSTQHWKECGTCEKKFDLANHNFTYDPTQSKDDDSHGVKCACGATKTVSHDFSKDYTCVCGAVNSDPVTKVSISVNDTSLKVGDSAKASFVAYSAGNQVTDYITYEYYSDDSSVRIEKDGTITARYAGFADISVKVDGVWSDEVRVNVEADADLEVTIYEGMGTYYFSEEDNDGDSLEEQLYDVLDDAGYRYDYDELTFDITDKATSYGTTSYESKYDTVEDFGDVEFTVKKAGTFTANLDIYYTSKVNPILSGTITINIEEGGSAGDIIYTAKNGEDVEFDVDDFEDFWDDNSSKGSLDYVMFDSVSSSKGDLVDNEGDDVSTKTKYYVDPGSKQIDLDGITFEPARNLKTAVTIGFTAYGTNKKSVSGTVVILYTEKEPEAIVYNSTGKNITLDRDDFLDNYEDTVGSSASNIQIQFLDAPSNGTLYYNYNEKTEKGTELTSKNVQNYTFSTNTRASRSIEDVTYVPDSRGRTDTIKFAAYTSSGELRYYGEVTFGQTVQNVSVSMTSTSAGVTFQTSSFTGADSAMLTVSSISFGTPSSGTLYKNWTGTSGTRVTASDMFSYVASVTGNPSLSTVTYVPVAGYSGNVTIPFSAYSTTGNSIINGTVTIRVTATTTTTVFTDVPTTGSQAWAAPYISRLYSAGVVSGVTPTTYGPKQAVKWGEALKMVLRAAGYPAQTEGTGSNWAANYLTYAYNNGLVSSNSIDLNSNITRLEMAELAAKALKMSPASRINSGIVGPTDTTNGYVYALYNAGIVGGDSSSGQNRYNGGSSLNRDEMAKIVCGVMDYNG